MISHEEKVHLFFSSGRIISPINCQENDEYVWKPYPLVTGITKRFKITNNMILGTPLLHKGFQFLSKDIMSSNSCVHPIEYPIHGKYVQKPHFWYEATGFVITGMTALAHFSQMFRGRAYFKISNRAYRQLVDENFNYLQMCDIQGLTFDNLTDLAFMEHLMSDLSWCNSNE